MKKIIQPAVSEKVEYYSDISGQKVGEEYGPQVEVTFEYSYGSKFDGNTDKFHLSDDEAEKLLQFIRQLRQSS